MKKILMIATGGTIACRPDESGGLAPALSSEEIIEYAPEIKELCELTMLQLFNLDSTNIGPEHWLKLAEAIRDNVRDYDGFVITHGTDTMAYTAAALSYLIQEPDVPVVLTGSQKSISSRDTDARSNLICAFRYAVSDKAWGVQIVFDGKVILGTRARKIRSKSFSAFSSIDFPETAVFRDERLITYIEKPAEYGPMRVYGRLRTDIFFLRLIPGITGDIFDYLGENYAAVVIEGFGVGGIPDYGDGSLLQAVKKWSAAGKIAVFSTQVQHEGSDISVYEVGRAADGLPGILEAGEMTPESVAAKLMWALGQTENREEAEKLFLKPVLFDIL